MSCFSVALTSAINAGDVASLTVTAVLSTAQTAYPAEITQLDNQLMVYTDNVYVVSPYQVSAQMTEVRGSPARHASIRSLMSMAATQAGAHKSICMHALRHLSMTRSPYSYTHQAGGSCSLARATRVQSANVLPIPSFAQQR